MGAEPRTKSEYREAIARKQGELERLKADLARAKQTEKEAKRNNQVVSHGPSWVQGQIASCKSEIARLKAKMADAPK